MIYHSLTCKGQTCYPLTEYTPIFITHEVSDEEARVRPLGPGRVAQLDGALSQCTKVVGLIPGC